ncbi:MAG: hypothetical protein WBA57_14380 [Elainellaceae cyanobacterium]
MTRQALFVISATLAIATIATPASAQTERLVTEGCRQGYCWEEYLLDQQVVHQNHLGGVDNILYEVSLESHNSNGIEQRNQWVYCSTSEAFVAFDGFGDSELLYLHYLNPGGNQVGGYNADSHRLYWAVCHDVWQPDLWSPQNGLAQQARQLGYSLNLEEGQREIPRVMFR